MPHRYTILVSLFLSMQSFRVPASEAPSLARMWIIRDVRRGPEFNGMWGLPDVGSKFDLTSLAISPADKSKALWLDESGGKRLIRFTKEPERNSGAPAYFEVIELTDQNLQLALWVKLRPAHQHQHMITIELELSS